MKNPLVIFLCLIFAFVFVSCDSSQVTTEDSEILENDNSTSDLEFVLLNDNEYGVKCGENKKLETAVIPETYNGKPVIAIMDRGFDNCTSLKSITISNNVKSIGDSAFGTCINLTSVDMGNSVTSIGCYAFTGCVSLTSITIPSSVTEIKEYGISAIPITSIEIGSNATNIAFEAFSGCNNLTNITVHKDNPNYKSIDGVFYTKDGSTLIQYPAGKKEDSFIVPDSVEQIYSTAFACSKSLKEVSVGKNVKSIGSYAFRDCDSLENVIFDNINNWCLTYSYLETSGIEIDVSESERNARNIRGQSSGAIWRCDL